MDTRLLQNTQNSEPEVLLLAHPDHSLMDHLRGVYHQGMRLWREKPFSFREDENPEIYRRVLAATLLGHDVGKATPWFQKYIKSIAAGEAITFKRDERQLKRHSLLSALLVFHQLLVNSNIDPEEVLLPALMGFILVRHHHGDLKDFRDLITVIPEDWELVKTQVRRLDFPFANQIFAIDPVFRTKITPTDFLAALEQYQPKWERQRRKVARLLDDHLWNLFLYLYSIMLAADKNDTVYGEKPFTLPGTDWSSRLIDTHRRRLFSGKSPLSSLREKLYQQVMISLERAPKDQSLFSLTAPTGAGKTLAALRAALLIQERYGLERVIYCLPYLSIIEQNVEVMRRLREAAKLETSSAALLEHDHLATLRYRMPEDQGADIYNPGDVSLDWAQFLVEGWESRLIVTTFVQFINTLFPGRNAVARRRHQLARAVIILDEVQAFPHKYWRLVRVGLEALAERLGSRIILMSATMPLIFPDKEKRLYELFQNYQGAFQNLSRTVMEFPCRFELLEWEDFVEEIEDLPQRYERLSLLFVLNTIKSAQELFVYLKSRYPEREWFFLSSHVLPVERKRRIAKLRAAIAAGRPVGLVSTQLIEAGVDLDFNLVVRDFAPLDSLIQCAGRCNRHAYWSSPGRVLVYRVKDQRGYETARIYDSFLRAKTLQVLAGYGATIPEPDYGTLAANYYQAVWESHSSRPSSNILTALAEWLFKTALDVDESDEALRLIDENFTGSLFIPLDADAQRAWEAYRELLWSERTFERKAEIKEAFRRLAPYIINVPKKCLPPRGNGKIHYLTPEEVELYYDHTLGFRLDQVVPEKTEMVLF